MPQHNFVNQRKTIQQQHEKAVIEAFLRWTNSINKTNYHIESYPNPPDAIIVDGSHYSWIEHTDTYRSSAEAIDELTAVTPGEKHIPHKNGIGDPDQNFSKELIDRLGDKLSKTSYQPIFQKYGKGFLLITERDPLFSESSLQTIRNYMQATQFSDKGYFHKVYLAYRCSQEMIFEELIYKSVPAP